LALGDRLRAEGLDAIIDQYEEAPPEGWLSWMVNQVRGADYVLVVCTEAYTRRFEGAETPGTGKGVKWEGAIITQELYDDEGRNRKFIPVVFTDRDLRTIPVTLRRASHYDVGTETGYERLYRRLTNQPEIVKPPIGPMRRLAARGAPGAAESVPGSTIPELTPEPLPQRERKQDFFGDPADRPEPIQDAIVMEVRPALPFTEEELAALVGRRRRHAPKLVEMQFVETLSSSPASVVAKYAHGEKLYVLKRTLRAVCQEDTLAQLAGRDFQNWKVSIACPLETWAVGDHVWELRAFITGVTLHRLILSNQYHINGSFIVALFHGLAAALDEMHAVGILHRDVRPQNLLLRPSGDLVLIDCTFCCRADLPQVPVANDDYTPEEQRAGRAVVTSDWYSLAGTIFFLVNGSPPPRERGKRLHHGLQAIRTYGYDPSPLFKPSIYGVANAGVSSVFEALLNPDVNRRPSHLNELLLAPHTIVPKDYDVIGVLDVDGEHFLVVRDTNFEIYSKPILDHYLEKARRSAQVRDQDLLEDIDQHLAGRPPWRHTMSGGA
jgi:Protein kinase domain/TIR domain